MAASIKKQELIMTEMDNCLEVLMTVRKNADD